ncbi:SDR family NAD(P)-dependent oxidoreductase [Rhodovulum sp. 12E13]|uniref:SDR family oxidoreductase n=1 Tax=Rhodovulum sp. 12E13 TaxID=2203891 RepID=UPI000E1AC0D6|nr:SDR family oxidoreductase [Rhodovulum sp. 12E13]RDC74760.1 SDR family NAD(P)-dependent oxidoreductase [Rhodovulum sp. 12E13]
MAGTLLSLGHGYSARTLAQSLGPGWRVIGTTRSPDKAAALREEGVEPRVWPGADLSDDIAEATHILASAGPDEAGDPFLRRLGGALARARPAWVGYLSTTGVYGDADGDWVDEDSPLAPGTERGRRRALAEEQWRTVSEDGGWPLAIFRLAGIYGPGRGPFERVRSGTARRIVKPGQVFSRIHVDDIAQVVAAAMARPEAAAPGGTAFNVCDDDPAPPQDVLEEAARLLGLPPPPEVPFEAAGMSPMARSFYAESKRVRNDRIKERLGVRLLYPTYREGLAAVLAAEGG